MYIKIELSSYCRNLFSRKSKDADTDDDQQGWKLFGRVPPKQISVSKAPQQISCEYQQRTALQNAAAKGKKQDIEVMSTTALILENRPMWVLTCYAALWKRRGILLGTCRSVVSSYLLCPPLKKEGHIALHMSVGMSVGRYVGIPSVSLNLVQLITQECFAQEASNLVGR